MMRKWMMTVGVICLFAFLLLGRTVFTAMAGEEPSAPVRYYKSIQIEAGDSLWGIAQEYCGGGDMSAGEYVRQLKEMNQLEQDTIHAGQYLTVVYFQQ